MKEYVAVVNQSETNALEVVVCKNTFTGSLTWVRTNSGRFELRSENGEFPAGRTLMFFGRTSFLREVAFERGDVETLWLAQIDSATRDYADNLDFLSVRVEVYP